MGDGRMGEGRWIDSEEPGHCGVARRWTGEEVIADLPTEVILRELRKRGFVYFKPTDHDLDDPADYWAP